eukprot:1283508-Prymnesium_polylepis.3
MAGSIWELSARAIEGTDRSIDEIGGTSHTAMHARHIKSIRIVYPQARALRVHQSQSMCPEQRFTCAAPGGAL